MNIQRSPNRIGAKWQHSIGAKVKAGGKQTSPQVAASRLKISVGQRFLVDAETTACRVQSPPVAT